MIKIIYRWLPRIFGCHCRCDRSFHYKGYQFPLCARCTGELAGIVLSVAVFRFWKPTVDISCIMLLPLIIDGLIQRLTVYESTNIRRLITGVLFGIGLTALFVQSTVAAIEFGIEYGRSFSG